MNSTQSAPALNDIADPTDATVIYFLILGRRPENFSVAKGQAGRPIGETILGFALSDEFRLGIAADMVDGRLQHYERLGLREYQSAARWVGNLLNVPVPESEISWWLLISLILGNDAFIQPLADGELTDFVEFAQTAAAAENAQFTRLAPFFEIDPAWFFRMHATPWVQSATATIGDVATYVAEHADGPIPQLLPTFSEGLDAARVATDTQNHSLRALLAETLSGARSGLVTHWLFSADFYRHVLALQDDLRPDLDRKLDTAGDLYLDFLSRDEEKKYSPHPLFSHHAYAQLNPAADFQYEATYRDYLSDGCFKSKRTSPLFDEDFYLAFNPEAKMAVITGTHVSALHHFITVGLPLNLAFSPDFDVAHYVETYADVMAAVHAGEAPSPTWHFLHKGLSEGRSPNPYFDPAYYRQRYPQANAEMRRLGIVSELEHFLLIGKARGYRANPSGVGARSVIEPAKAIFQRRTRRSFDRIMQRPMDFRLYCGANPALSLIVPVFNEAEFTCRFLECAFFAAAHFQQVTKLTCEIVVVDNGSTDQTKDLLSRCDGLNVITFDGPIGFPRAVNAGVAGSSGAIVVVANNDIAFEPDILVNVWTRLAADDRIGVLGGLTILPDETLQEAGSFLDSKANVVGLGRRENPWDAYFQGVNEADYCTGSFVSFRRVDFEQLGGFDEGFSPGYYEETDFTFRMRRELGKHAAVDSAIQVTHFEHASFGRGRPPATAYALIKRNQARFIGKHRDALRTRPASLELVTTQGARPHRIGRARMLVIEDLIPDTRLGSGFVRSSQLLAGLARHGLAFDLMILAPTPAVDEYADPRVTVFRDWMPGEGLQEVLETKATKYSHVMVCRTHNLKRVAAQLERLRHEHGFQVIVDTEALSVLRKLEVIRLSGKTVSAEDRLAGIRMELEAPVEVSQWLAVSPFEKSLIEEAGFAPVIMVSHNFGDGDGVAGPGWGERFRILAVGAVHEPYSPNHDGLIWFMEDIYPRCEAVFESLVLTIAGFWHPDVLATFRARYPDVRIEFTGPVSEEDLAQLYAETRIALAPTRFAAGVASKVLQAMMLGVPVVMTDLLEAQLVGEGGGVTGLAVGLRSDDGESFARWLTVLATDETAWEEVRRKQVIAAAPIGGERAFEEGITQFVLYIASPREDRSAG